MNKKIKALVGLGMLLFTALSGDNNFLIKTPVLFLNNGHPIYLNG